MTRPEKQPNDAIFEDMRQASLKTWNKYDDTYGYRTEKTDQVKGVQNFADNWCTFLGMMDSTNQAEFVQYVELQETRDFLNAQRQWYGFPEM